MSCTFEKSSVKKIIMILLVHQWNLPAITNFYHINFAHCSQLRNPPRDGILFYILDKTCRVRIILNRSSDIARHISPRYLFISMHLFFQLARKIASIKIELISFYGYDKWKKKKKSGDCHGVLACPWHFRMAESREPSRLYGLCFADFVCFLSRFHA